MAQFVIANNVNTQLAAALPASGAGSTTVVLASSTNLPPLNTAIGQQMPLTLNDAATGAIYEIVYVTAISGATLTVLRGQEGTSALNWNVGDFAFCGPTAGTVGLTTMRTQYQASASFSSSQTLTAAIAGESVGFTGTSAATFSMPGQSTVPSLTPTAVYNDGTAALTLTANGSDKFVVATGQVTSIVMQPGDDLSFYASTTSGQWQATAGSALRQYEPLVVGAATASQHAMQLGQATGRLISVRVFTASGTYTPTAGTNSVDVELVGGGGGGGGTVATGSSAVSIGGGGGAGAYSRARFTTGFSGVTMTVGAAGTGGASGGGTGGTGGSTSFGALMGANGGFGGQGGSSSAPVYVQAGGAGGAAGTGNILAQSGQPGQPSTAAALGSFLSGGGAPTKFGGGGAPIGTNTLPGNPAGAYGAGGGGAGNGASTSAQTGGAGGQGVIIITEYF
ncbi:hypothetical protein SAMN05216466_10763 [Paraburkholderia phenazinium]|uniref:Glycine-rich domain-containing protein n=1 Tax=Paraburkholderia phenazinium TaxID=60549 RepID=A0A1G7ZJZ3_9BURK|nr:hypothetical protein [Paraburkholderia phenazinium]SDH09028.1 hypothetical protein SAMN05216466_10763 [Paraburkholderia phenazinium]